MKQKILALSLILAFVGAYMVLPNVAAAQATSNPTRGITLPIAGTTAASTTSGPLSNLAGGTVTGTFNVQRFGIVNGSLAAIGTLVANITSSTGQVTTLVLHNVALTAANAGSACPILSLTLGPLHLDLLGLVIDLNQVNLNITAQPGPGNLLGNLLCDVANLLNNNGGLSQIVGLLNQILGQL